jgi:hypothetical protein
MKLLLAALAILSFSVAMLVVFLEKTQESLGIDKLQSLLWINVRGGRGTTLLPKGASDHQKLLTVPA